MSGEGSNKNSEGNETQPKSKPRAKQINRNDSSDDGADGQKEKRPRKEKAQVTESEDIEMCGQGDLKGTGQGVGRPPKCQQNVNNKLVSSLSKHHTCGETHICTQSSDSEDSIMDMLPPRKKNRMTAAVEETRTEKAKSQTRKVVPTTKERVPSPKQNVQDNILVLVSRGFNS